MSVNSNKRQSFINEDSLPGILLLVATIIALIFANTPLRDFYNKVILVKFSINNDNIV